MVNYPDDWREVHFDDVIIPKARIGWQGLKKHEYLKRGYSYLISGTDFHNGTISLDNIWYVSRERYDMDENIQVQEGDVLVTKDGTIGKVAIVPKLDKPATLNSHVYVFRTKDTLNAKFLYRVLMSKIFRQFINYLQSGSIIASLAQKDLKNFSFMLPPLHEQQAIADTLSVFDTHITNLAELIAKKKAIRDGALEDLMSGRTRLKGFSGEWTVKKLGECVTILQGGTPSTLNRSYWGGDIVWVTPSEITALKSMYISDSERKITRDGLIHSSATLVPAGTILLCSRATIGELAIATRQMTTNQGFKNLLCKENIYNVFLAYLLLTLKKKLISLANGTTFLELSKQNLTDVEIPLPPLDEQQAIAETLTAFDDEIASLEAERDKITQIRDGAMNDLLTGKVRLT